MDTAAPAPTPARAGFAVRSWAFLLDVVVYMAVTAPLLLALYGPGYFDLSRDFTALGMGFWDTVISYVLLPVAIVACWRWKGATPGKWLAGVRVVDARTGATPGTGRLVVRCLAYLLSALPFGAGFIWIRFDRERRALHDRIAGTAVADLLATPAAAATPATVAAPAPAGSTAPSTGDVAPAGIGPLALSAFRIGATLLLLATAVGGVRALFNPPTRSSEIADALRDAGLLTPVVEALATHARAGSVVLAALIGLVLVWRASHRPEARVLALLLGFHFFSVGPLRAMGLDPGAVELARRLSDWLALAALLRFATVFPRAIGRAELADRGDVASPGAFRRFAWMAAERFDAGAVAARAAAWARSPRPAGLRLLVLSPAVVWGTGLAIPLAIHAFPAVGGRITLLVVAAVATALVATMTLLRLNIRGADEVERGRALWAVYGLIVAIAIPLGLAVIAVTIGTTNLMIAELRGVEPRGLDTQAAGYLVGMVASTLSPLIVVVTMAVAILYRGAIDSGLAIRRTTLYAALGGLAVILFAAMEYLLSVQLARVIALPDAVSGMVSAAVSATAVSLGRHRMGRRTDRLLDRVLPAAPAPPARDDVPAHAVVLAADLAFPPGAPAVDPGDAVALSAALGRHARRLAVAAGGSALEAAGAPVVLACPGQRAAADIAAALHRAMADEAAARGVAGVRVVTGIGAGPVAVDAAGEAFGPAVEEAVRRLRAAPPVAAGS